MTNKNYQQAIKYELGIDQVKDYNKAYHHYLLASSEGDLASVKKVKYGKMSISHIIIVALTMFFGLYIDIVSDYVWLGLMFISITNLIIALYYKPKYWRKTHISFIFNELMFYVMIIIILPYSMLSPYMSGLTWLPMVVLLTLSFFMAFSMIVIHFFDKQYDVKKYVAIGLYLFALSIGALFIETDDKRFIFYVEDDGVVITGYRSDETELVLPRTLSGYDVIGIGDGAFSGVQFETIQLHNNLKFVGNNAFSKNTKLVSIDIPDGVILGQSVFADNFNLETVKLPSDLINLGSRTFYNNFKLKEIELPDTLKRIDSEAFYNSGLLVVDVPTHLEVLGNDVFYGTKIRILELPESLHTLGSLSNMRELEAFNIPHQITSLPDNFLSYNTLMEQFDVPEQVISIGRYAFAYTNLNVINFHEDIQTIQDGIFYRATGIKNITLPENITVIPSQTFAYSSLESYHVGSHVTSIEKSAFLNATNLQTITFDEGIRLIGHEAFYNNISLTNLVLPDSIISLGDSSFEGATSLKTVQLPTNLDKIPNRLFYGAEALETIDIPESVTSIGTNAFRNTNLKTLVLPNDLKEIQNGAFYGNSALYEITFNEGLEHIGVQSFGDNVSLTSIDLPNSLLSIGEYAFFGARNLETFTIGPNVLSVGYRLVTGKENMIIYIKQDSIPASWHHGWNPMNHQIIFINA